jgi:hypothetical protein
MPASAGRVRMPHNNRMSTSGALQTSDIWQKTIGYEFLFCGGGRGRAALVHDFVFLISHTAHRTHAHRHDPHGDDDDVDGDAAAERQLHQQRVDATNTVLAAAREQNATGQTPGRDDFALKLYQGLKQKKKHHRMEGTEDTTSNAAVGRDHALRLHERDSSSEEEYVAVVSTKKEQRASPAKAGKKKRKKKKESKKKRRSRREEDDDDDSNSSSDSSSSDSDSSSEEHRRRRKKHKRSKKRKHKAANDKDDDDDDDSSRRKDKKTKKSRRRKSPPQEDVPDNKEVDAPTAPVDDV